jgi:hypothetical protein
LQGLAYGDGGKLAEERAILGAAHRQGNGFDGVPVVTYQGGGGERNYFPVQRRKESLDQAVAQVAKNTGLSPDEVLSQLGPADEARQALLNAGNLAASHHMGITNAAQRVAQGLGSHLIGSNADLRSQAMAELQVTPQSIGSALNLQDPAVVKREAGSALLGEDETRRKAELEAMGIRPEDLAQKLGMAPGNQPGGADARLPEWLPQMQDLAPWQTLAGYGAATAGIGAGGVMLANHLMAQGQQQSDPIAYAKAMQSLAAY